MKDLRNLQEQLIQAITEDNDEQAKQIAHNIAASAQEDFPALHSSLNALGYHDRLALMNDVMREAWPQVQEAADFTQAAVNAYAGRATDHLIYAYLSEREAPQEEPDASDPELVERLEDYFPVDPGRLYSYLRLLNGTAGRQWSMPDFEPLTVQQLHGLMIEFLGYAHRYEGVPYSRAHLVREHLPRYLLDREAGNLVPKPDVAAALRQGRRPFPEQVPEPLNPLSPDDVTLKLFLQRMLQTMEPLPYAAAAILELLPVWVRFLRFRQLLDEETAGQTLQRLDGLGEALASYWGEHPDLALRQKVATWPPVNGRSPGRAARAG